MAKADIWMPFYVASYLADTLHLTTEQHGAYLLLILHYWRKGPPPDDDAILATITKLTPTRWKKNKKVLQNFFQIANGVLEHKRIETERITALKNSELRSKKAQLAARERWLRHYAPSITQASIEHANAMLALCPVPIPISVQPAPKPEPVPDVLPAWLKQETWGAFLEHRKNVKAPLTALAKTRILNELEKLHKLGFDPIDVIDQTIMNNWTGVFPIRRVNGAPSAQGPQWWASKGGIDSKGAELGMSARPGESHEDYKARINKRLLDTLYRSDHGQHRD